MVQPPSFADSTNPHLVFSFCFWVSKLEKTLNALKQSPRAWWYSSFSSFLISHGFIIVTVRDSYLFLHKTFTSLLIVLVHVDDILLHSNDSANLKFCFFQNDHLGPSMWNLRGIPSTRGVNFRSISVELLLETCLISAHKFTTCY